MLVVAHCLVSFGLPPQIKTVLQVRLGVCLASCPYLWLEPAVRVSGKSGGCACYACHFLQLSNFLEIRCNRGRRVGNRAPITGRFHVGACPFCRGVIGSWPPFSEERICPGHPALRSSAVPTPI